MAGLSPIKRREPRWIRPHELDLVSDDVAHFTALAGDRRTGNLVDETVRGILGSERLNCARIAAISP